VRSQRKYLTRREVRLGDASRKAVRRSEKELRGPLRDALGRMVLAGLRRHAQLHPLIRRVPRRLLTLIQNTCTVARLVRIGAALIMSRLAQMTWQRGNEVQETYSLFAHLRPGCGESQVKANPCLADTGPPSS
jgi:hypothetical protein